MKIELKHPIIIKDGDGAEGSENKITYVMLRRIRAKDMKTIPDDLFGGGAINPAKMIPLISSITGFKIEHIEEFDIEDILTIVGQISDFLSQPQSTPGK